MATQLLVPTLHGTLQQGNLRDLYWLLLLASQCCD
jgi:hypothetical protein